MASGLPAAVPEPAANTTEISIPQQLQAMTAGSYTYQVFLVKQEGFVPVCQAYEGTVVIP